MISILFTAFLIISLLAEYYLWRYVIPGIRTPFWRKAYKYGTLFLWILTAGGVVLFKIFPSLPGGMYRIFEGTTPWFLFMCAAKTIFAVFALIGGKTKLRPVFYTIATALIIVANCIMTYSTTTGRMTLRTERVDMVSGRVPDHLDGFRIAVFSDIHVGSLLDRRMMLTRIVEEINSLDPDVVIHCGDLINKDYTELEPWILGILSGIESVYGVYGCVGNHESGKHISKKGLTPEENLRKVAELQESIGWRLLVDETVYIPVNGDTISITGSPFPRELTDKQSHGKLTTRADYSYLYADKPDGQFNITISHTPAAWEDILATGRSTLTLSGHVHSFQMKLKFGKRSWSPASLFYEYWSGPYSKDGRYLYVNDGIGYSLVPMRLWTKPEITLIELRKCE